MKTRFGIRDFCTGFFFLVAVANTAAADINVQNAQYNEEKSALFVKGKLTGNGVVRVYVIDVERKAQIGAIDTFAKGQQFSADVPIASIAAVPCVIKVQTTPMWGGMGLFGAIRVNGGDYTIATVRQAPEHCAQ